MKCLFFFLLTVKTYDSSQEAEIWKWLLEHFLSCQPGAKPHICFAVTPLDCYQHGNIVAVWAIDLIRQAPLKMTDSLEEVSWHSPRGLEFDPTQSHLFTVAPSSFPSIGCYLSSAILIPDKPFFYVVMLKNRTHLDTFNGLLIKPWTQSWPLGFMRLTDLTGHL